MYWPENLERISERLPRRILKESSRRLCLVNMRVVSIIACRCGMTFGKVSFTTNKTKESWIYILNPPKMKFGSAALPLLCHLRTHRNGHLPAPIASDRLIWSTIRRWIEHVRHELCWTCCMGCLASVTIPILILENVDLRHQSWFDLAVEHGPPVRNSLNKWNQPEMKRRIENPKQELCWANRALSVDNKTRSIIISYQTDSVN